MAKKIIAAALGECVHVAGIYNFLRLAENAGWETHFLGPAVSVEKVIEAIQTIQPDMVGISYRLTPETGERLLGEFAEKADEFKASGTRFIFGGTPPVVERVKKIGFFDRVFDGSQSKENIMAFLRGEVENAETALQIPQTTIERIRWKEPFPILRHHFGLPTMQATIDGIKKIAEAGVLDVVSLGIDQDAQENFFHPERQQARRKGAGGVPVRTPEDYEALFNASRTGNFPMLRTYSGTDDFIRMAEMSVKTIHNAWCAIPLFWFNQMDSRGPWDLKGSINEHQKVLAWYGERNIPVEMNEPHHWGMRDAPDVIFVVAAYLAAYNARAFGVKDYIAQMMFNSPPGASDAMDLAKMLAIQNMVEPLTGPDFRLWRQTRTGLLSYPLDDLAARSHLATSIYLQMAIKPHIIHVVGHTEAHHAALPEDVIEACKMANQAIDNALKGSPEMISDARIQKRAKELIKEAQITLGFIRSLGKPGCGDPLTDPAVLSRAVTNGIMDAPHLKNNPFARGTIKSKIIDGACYAVDDNNQPISEKARIKKIGVI